MKFTLNLLGRHRDEERRWPSHVFGGHVRTSTLALIVAFLAVWWVYNTYGPDEPSRRGTPPVQVVPPGFVPDPNYTWVPRTRVEQPEPTYTPPPPTTTTPTTAPTTTTTTPPPFTLPPPPCLLPPPFCPGPTSATPPSSAPSSAASSPAQQPLPGPGPSPSSPPPVS